MSAAEALLALAAGDAAGAAGLARQAAARAPGARLPRALADHLARAAAGTVYDEPSAFQEFISGGGNLALYATTTTALRALHAGRRTTAVTDIGCGDGRVTAGARPATCRRVDLVEPSAPLLAEAVARLAGRPVTVEAHATTLAGYLAGPAGPVGYAQSTFALHAVAPAARGDALVALRSRVDGLALAEFDVPGFADRSPEHAAYAADRYERGLAEYPDGSPVGPGFLLPVLTAQFAPDRPRVTWEQPIDRWVADLTAAGYTVDDVVPLVDYWWAPARLVVARP
ncbi:MAG TPA: class I SAM-dependent methyltransferase [Acidimicrobiales bacterium]|nr:class I SAM-dependent methyltransferase [Acidimicrobiales bacterium]